MTAQTIRVLLAVGALAACGGDEEGRPACDGAASCAVSPPEGDTERDASASSAARGDAGQAATPKSDAAVTPGSADAGQAAQDAAARTDAATPVASGDAVPSTGCGAAAPTGGKGTIDVMGSAREYILTLPKNYNPTKPYKLVFAWHGLGGTAEQIAFGYYGLRAQAGDGAIFVAGQGLQTSNPVGSGPGWANTNGQDVAFVKALYAQLQSQVCFDESRVFSVGMSYGGIMSNTVGCQMGDVFRAIAPMSGGGPGFGGRATCVGQVAAWMSHGNTDRTVPTSSGQGSRDFWVKANHCEASTMPVEPSPCVAYTGCDEGNPVTWCEFEGGHIIPPFAAKAIWTFFSQF